MSSDPAMTPAPVPPAPRRHVWRWVFIGLGIALTPFLVLAAVAASFLTLNRDAVILRKHVMAATDADWHTKVQLSIGDMSLAAVRTGLCFAHGRDIDDARLALAAVRRASVGVYESRAYSPDWSRPELFRNADQAMARRGWTRLVGVADHQDTVLVYASDDLESGKPVDLCVAVVNGRELVVVSTSINADKLADLVARHTPADLKHRLHLIRL
jgi:hypothetical protein